MEDSGGVALSKSIHYYCTSQRVHSQAIVSLSLDGNHFRFNFFQEKLKKQTTNIIQNNKAAEKQARQHPSKQTDGCFASGGCVFWTCSSMMCYCNICICRTEESVKDFISPTATEKI